MAIGTHDGRSIMLPTPGGIKPEALDFYGEPQIETVILQKSIPPGDCYTCPPVGHSTGPVVRNTLAGG